MILNSLHLQVITILACHVLQLPKDCVNTGLFPVQGMLVIFVLFFTREDDSWASYGKVCLAFIPLAFTVLIVFQTLCEVV
jgi:hypothetical protein